MPPELRRLMAVLEHADSIVIKRVTEVARWLLAGQTLRRSSSHSSKRAAK
jgi:hypothetical protein